MNALDDSLKASLRLKLLNWYAHNHRSLPWRDTQDAYRIWLSEVILQQTRVNQGLPYYEAFVQAYPSLLDLAAASEQAVLRLWQGLGYYSRARNMLHTARQLAALPALPDTYAKWLTLKGIGPYTAAAIASFAFGERVAVLDGNVYRVLARLLGISTDIASPQAKKEFTALANELLDPAQPGLFNQAIMELGALVCTPRSPDCLLCPFNTSCVACLTGRQSELPIKTAKKAPKTLFFHYLVFEWQGKLALRERGPKGIWQGLYDFYLIEKASPLSLPALAALQPLLDGSQVRPLEELFVHQLTHRTLHARFWQVQLPTEAEAEALQSQTGMHFFTPQALESLPKPALISRYLSQYPPTQ